MGKKAIDYNGMVNELLDSPCELDAEKTVSLRSEPKQKRASNINPDIETMKPQPSEARAALANSAFETLPLEKSLAPQASEAKEAVQRAKLPRLKSISSYCKGWQ